MPDSVRLAVGTLTALRVPAPGRVDRRVARGAMLVAPVVGLLLGAVAAAVLALVGVVAPDDRAAVDLLGSALAVAVLAWATRGLHLDGLADTADGLGVKGSGEDVVVRRLAVMRAPDVGAFGVVAVALVLLVDVAALTVCSSTGLGVAALLVAGTTSRLAVTLGCTPWFASARPDGLGSAVVGTVPRLAAGGCVLLVVGCAVAWGVGSGGGAPRALGAAGSVLLAVLAGWWLLRRCARRLGGVTGDVLGAAVEVAFAVALVATALLAR